MPISKPHTSLKGDNTGSCGKLVEYLDKENQELDKLASNAKNMDQVANYENRKMYFFSHQNDHISQIEVRDTIDSNKRKLGKNDAKFYAPTISFSKQELKTISEKATNGRNVKSVWEMSQSEFQKYNCSLREYCREAMNNYAENFNRQDKGLKSGNNLVYFAKIEHNRAYKGTDREVVHGIAKSGQKKPGLQSHIHIIVSRKDKTQQLKLSPIANEKNKTRTIGKNLYKVGFDRNKWIKKNENSFDQMFEHKRKETEKFEVQNILKNGSLAQKEQTKHHIEKEKNKEMSNLKNLER